ncbi:MAG: AbrB/MazE/SpoVT family DNA-binding domain-containing protein [Candidatus Woesearchaeota archaeon]
MDGLEITRMSSRGQVVIPIEIREYLGLKEGEKFIVFGEDDTIILKKISVPSFKTYDELIRKTMRFAKEKDITKAKLGNAIKETRKKNE